jgi:hypothetical protein
MWGFHYRYNIQFWNLLSTCKSETPSLAYLDVMRRVAELYPCWPCCPCGSAWTLSQTPVSSDLCCSHSCRKQLNQLRDFASSCQHRENARWHLFERPPDLHEVLLLIEAAAGESLWLRLRGWPLCAHKLNAYFPSGRCTWHCTWHCLFRNGIDQNLSHLRIYCDLQRKP